MKIPALVRRHTVILALSQALVGAGTQLVPSLGPLLSVELLGSAALAGAGISIVGISRLIIAYPLGKLMDIYGRRAGLALGLSVAILGTVLVGFSVIWHSIPAFVIGMLIFGMGMGAAQQLRLAAADMYPPSRRAEGLGYVLTGSLLGALGAPLVVSVAQAITPGLGIPLLATPWLIVPAVILPTLVLIFFLRPDPREIGAHLERYYPGYQPDLPARVAEQTSVGADVSAGRFPRQVAVVSCFAAQGTMSMVMVLTSLALARHGHELPAISLSVSVHVIGMFGFSIPLGKLGDAIGRRSILVAGSVIAILGTLLVPSSPEYWVITLGTFLVGLGWSCVNVASTAVIADTTQAHVRGRAIGKNDAFASAAGIFLPLIAGPMVDSFGLGAVSVLGVVVMALPLPLLVRLREPSPGKYGDAIPAA
ncbi:MAG: MFS transporter [Dehalococcoidia bacterium]|nr:MFS transporter [Dehalococcoidia bacterium]